MKTYRLGEAPLSVHGVPYFAETGRMERLSPSLRAAVPTLSTLGCRTPGARLCFRTDATSFHVRITLATLSLDAGMSLYAAHAACVMIGERSQARFAGLVGPQNYTEKTAERHFVKSGDMEDITIWLPRNEPISDVTVTLPDTAKVEAPTPYRYPPMLFYGSSITEGACCSRVTNTYAAILSRHLDADYYNFGFSGYALGEEAVARYIRDIPMSLFVLDYDHNAGDAAYLQKTHAPFFRLIREKDPQLPILILTKPNFDYDPHAAERRAVIRATYEAARAAGDEAVYFLDGETFFGEQDRELCTVDRVHPNDLGAYRMAAVMEPVVSAILQTRYGR